MTAVLFALLTATEALAESHLRIDVPKTDLVTGEHVQLTVLLVVDGTVRSDLTADEAVRYNSADSSIVTVSPAGIVTGGVTAGRANVVVTTDEAAVDPLVATVTFNVVPPGDADSDGMPDAYETARGFNSHDPSDAAGDADGDGLTNLEEYRLGSNPRIADTDGDGVPDGQEVGAGRNPLVADNPPHGGEDGLDERCVVSALNRAARVSGDGEWFLTNIPTNLGPIRVYATCVNAQGTRGGQSDYLAVTPGSVFDQIPMHLDAVVPIPAKVALTSSPGTLSTVGSAAQLTAVATYPDNIIRDVTAVQGTVYQSSNPNVLSVSSAGLVTARSSGSAIVVVTFEGALALYRFSINSVLDSDGDGIPDDYELANGLNPFDPTDAHFDTDYDGLSNLDEYRRGTDPNNFDSDKDGVSDGLEVQTGTDPLNANSFNLGKALLSLLVTPNPVNIIYETLLGVGSRTMVVQGNLVDANWMNVTPRSTGTTYTTADPAIAAAGSIDGQILGFAAGATAVTVVNNGVSIAVPVNVTTFTPALVGSVSLTSPPQAIAVVGNYAYMTTTDQNMWVVDVHDRAHPALLTGAPIPGYTGGPITATATRVYVADATGVTVVDVSIPSFPHVLTHYTLTNYPGFSGGVRDIVREVRYLILATANGLLILDETGTLTSSVPLGDLRSVSIHSANLIAALNSVGGLSVVDVSQGFGFPVLKGSVQTASATWVRVWGEFAYVNGPNGLGVVDINLPQPKILSTSPLFTGSVTRLAVRDGYAFLGMNLSNGVGFADVSNSLQPAAKTNVSLLGLFTNSIDADQRFVYVANGSQFGGGQLSIIQYFGTSEPFGIPPAVKITSPAADITVAAGATVPFTVVATDDVIVDAIHLFTERGLYSSSKARPTTFQYRIPSGVTDVNVFAAATDFGGNYMGSNSIHITVVPDTQPPSVNITSPTAGTITGGQTITVAASATDNGSVASVQFFANGSSIGSAAVAPFQVSYFVPTTATSITFTATATDGAGNSANSAPVTVSVAGDRPPTIRVVSPTSGAGLWNGADIHIQVEATDDVGIKRVDFLLNGQYVQGGTFSPPYDRWVALPLTQSTVSIQAEATDTKNQVTRSGAVTLNVTATSALSSASLAAFPWDMAIQGHYAYIGTSTALQVVDIANSAAPAVVGTLSLPTRALGVRVAGSYAFISGDTAGLEIIDVSNPANPLLVSTLHLPAPATSLLLDEDRLFVGTDLGVQIYDVRTPATPQPLSFMPTTRPARRVALSGQYVFVAQDFEGVTNQACFRCSHIVSFDLSDITAPRRLGVAQSSASGRSDYINTGMTAVGDKLYLAGDWYFSVMDISNPAALVELTTFDNHDTFHCCWRDIRPLGGLLFTGWFEQKSLTMIDARDLLNIGVAGQVDFTTFGIRPTLGIPTPELAYVIGGNSNPASSTIFRFAIGRYRTVQDTAAQPPQVTITRPAPAATVFERQTLPITVDATDDVGVTSVTIAVDGANVATLTAPPYTVYYAAPLGVAPHIITATATDFGGNSASAAPVTINVIADTAAPGVRITWPAPGASFPGSAVTLRAAASDNLGVAGVTFTVNGQPVGTATAPPYEVSYSIPAGTASFALAATAVDAAGNIGSAAPVTISVAAPAVLGVLTLTGTPGRLAVNGRYAFVAAGASGLHIVDIEDPVNPALVTTVALPNVTDVQLSGPYAYVMADRRVTLLDVTNPALPVQLSQFALQNGLTVALIGTHAFPAGGSIITDIDLTDPTTPRQISQQNQGRGFFSVARPVGRWVLVLTNGLFGGNSEVEAYDTSYSLLLFPVVGYSDTIGNQILHHTFNDIASTGDLVVVARPDGLSFARFTSTFVAPLITNTTDAYTSVAAYDNWLLAGHGGATNTAVLFDVSDRAIPTARGLLDVSGRSAAPQNGAALTPTLAVLTTADTQSNFLVARYRTYADTFGIAPAVSVTAAGSVAAGKMVNVKADASDDVGVAAVTFIVNGVDVFTDTVAPYAMNYRVPAGTTSLTIGARATDFGGNTSTATAIQLP